MLTIGKCNYELWYALCALQHLQQRKKKNPNQQKTKQKTSHKMEMLISKNGSQVIKWASSDCCAEMSVQPRDTELNVKTLCS